MINLIACDCDGTILNSQKEISSKTLEKIKIYINKGNYFVLCSGRPYYRVAKFLKELGLRQENHYYIGLNGALICDGTGTKIISSKLLLKEDVDKIVDFAKKNDVCVSVYTYDTVYTEKVSDYVIKEGIYNGVNVHLCKNLNKQEINDPIYKVLFVDYPEKIAIVRKKISTEIFNKYSIVSSAPHYLEFMNIEANKGKALLKLSNYLGINKAKIMAIGDAENDISMFNVTENSVAMGNADEEIKKNCKFVTLTNDNNGVEFIIDKLLKGEICNEL